MEVTNILIIMPIRTVEKFNTSQAGGTIFQNLTLSII
jgi:hypothetical protein